VKQKQGSPVLIVSADPGTRESLARELVAHWPVATASLEELGDRVRWVDAAAVVAALDGGEGQAGLERLEAVRAVPAARSPVLLARGVPDELLEEAVRRLGPAQLLIHPVPAPALRFAVARVMPTGPAGEGARRDHRRAPALLGVSAAIREVLDQVRRVASVRVPVLILGETGTGKELVARAIHEQGSRARACFVTVNCGAFPDSLLESELFGYRRGAFTGAERDKQGLFQQAHGGTLFLDEVGDTSPGLQVKLLRAIEEGEIRPLGTTEVRKVDVRIISATHRDLAAALEEGTFRQDLLYRLNTVTLSMPPLRRRKVDIAFLAQHFAEEFGERLARRVTLDEDFLEVLTQHDFPGNVRELRNAVERAIALSAPGEAVSARHLPPSFGALPAGPARLPSTGTLRDRIEQVEIHAIRETLQHCGGNRSRTAEALGLSRLGLRQKMRRLGLEKAPERAPEP
jgi:DNA-binding NtrC family response regulator